MRRESTRGEGKRIYFLGSPVGPNFPSGLEKWLLRGAEEALFDSEKKSNDLSERVPKPKLAMRADPGAVSQ